MKRYYFNDQDVVIKKDEKEKENNIIEKVTLDSLKQKISEMDILAELDVKSAYRATVIVHNNVGTTMFFAGNTENHFWLRKNAVKEEEAGSVHKYHFVLD